MLQWKEGRGVYALAYLFITGKVRVEGLNRKRKAEDARSLWMQVAAPAWAEVNKEQWRVQDSEPGGRLHPGAKLEENCCLRTMSAKRQHCKAIPQSSKETARWRWGFPA